MPQIAHFIEDAPESPNVRFITIRLVFKEFGTHVVRCPNASVSKILCIVKYLCNTEITKPDSAILEENVLSLEISVQYTSFMQIE